MSNELAEAMRDCFIAGRNPNQLLNRAFDLGENDSGFYEGNVADAMFSIAAALRSVATQIEFFGNGGNGAPVTTQAAIEALGTHIGEKLDSLTDAIGLIVSGENST